MNIATDQDLGRECYRLNTALKTATARANAKIDEAEAQLSADSAPHFELRQAAAALVEELRLTTNRTKVTVEEALRANKAKALVDAVSEERAVEVALELARARLDGLMDEGKRLFAGRVNALAARRRTVVRVTDDLRASISELWNYDERKREVRAEWLKDQIRSMELNA